jgi:hypothetical protein
VATNVMRKLNPHDRSTRNAEIVAARAAGESWRRIGERFDVSGRQARRIVKDVGASVTNTTAIDPIAIIEAADGCVTTLGRRQRVLAPGSDPWTSRAMNMANRERRRQRGIVGDDGDRGKDAPQRADRASVVGRTDRRVQCAASG